METQARLQQLNSIKERLKKSIDDQLFYLERLMESGETLFPGWKEFTNDEIKDIKISDLINFVDDLLNPDDQRRHKAQLFLEMTENFIRLGYRYHYREKVERDIYRLMQET